ncbi:hypothetical protein JQK15_13595 [Sphingobium sp. BHU LFT2]|uniref:hypothetical protein n=1 Tax=Sphingobium sp. BHU LFT2 TaxID=2807634 RepID=UPI001BE554EA|nr:hypothetical protein [Sphingobium sp. BHU LFT2]MBT2244573.1 hypothetical protein [Sphingobium sp. BHU LFT2]
MATDFYAEMADLIEELADEFLRPATLIRKTAAQTAYVPGTRKLAPASTVRLDCKAVAKPRATRLADGVLHHDTVLTLTVEPQIGDEIEQGVKTYKVTALETVAPTGVALVYRAVVSS